MLSLADMYYPDIKKFLKLAKKGLVVPIYKEILADLTTPVSAFRKLSKGSKYSFLLESVEGGEIIGRYSFLGVDPYLTFQSKGNKYRIVSENEKKQGLTDDPLKELKSIMKPFRSLDIEELPRFTGGAVGYISYPAIRFWEKIPKTKPDDLRVPDMFFLLTETVVVFDHVQHKMKVICNAFIKDTDKGTLKKIYNKSVNNIDAMVEKLKTESLSSKQRKREKKSSTWKSNFIPEDFIKAVDKAKQYIRAGDILQVVLSQRWAKKTNAEPIDIYRAIRSLNPSPYMFYLDFGGFKIIGSSPEIMVRKEKEKIILRPIAGTRPRGKDEEEDNKLIEELLKDPKERAEHLMLVDLGRNDVGRAAILGSVKVTELMSIEKYSHVMHIVSNVEGTLRKGCDEYDVLRASFPAGTVSGAPKIRAMEIIEELEPNQRGPYAGAVGYFSFSGNLDSCITIRTIILKNNIAYVQAGAGIVADSIGKREYKETLNKAKALMEAVELAEGELEQ
jgi:anthranilate synthase component 1